MLFRSMVAAVEVEGQLLLASVGDSRAYRFEHGALTPITDDQTWVNEIGRKLGLTTVAEGVETRKEWDMLAGLGCDLAQGYLIARPMTASAFDQWATSWAEQWPAA